VLSAPGAVGAGPAGTLPNSTVLNCTGPNCTGPNCTGPVYAGPNCTGQSPSGSPPLSRGLRAPAFWPVSRRPRGRRNCSAPIQGKPGRLPSGPSGPFLSHRLTELPGSQCSAPRSPCSGLRVTVLRSPGHRALLSGSPCSALRITVLGSPGHRAHLLGAPTAGPGSTHRPGPVTFRPTRLVATE
jgi:hypothetical protein